MLLTVDDPYILTLELNVEYDGKPLTDCTELDTKTGDCRRLILPTSIGLGDTYADKLDVDKLHIYLVKPK